MSGIRGVMLLGGGIPCPQISGSCRLTQFICIWVSNIICCIKAVGGGGFPAFTEPKRSCLQLFHLFPTFLNRRLCLFSRQLQCFRIHLSKKSWTSFKHCCWTIINAIFLMSASVSDGISVIFEQSESISGLGPDRDLRAAQPAAPAWLHCTQLDRRGLAAAHSPILPTEGFFECYFLCNKNQIWINKRLGHLNFLTGSLWNAV